MSEMEDGESTEAPASPPSSSAGLPDSAVARIWHGTTPTDKADEYQRLMRTVALPDYRSTPGNLGAFALQRRDGDVTHFIMLTFWESEEAIVAFVGDPVETARYYDFDAGFLLDREPTASHHRVFDR